MKKMLTLLACILAFTHSQAQNWNLINAGVTRYFVNNHHYLRAIAIDSVTAHGADLYYYPYRSGRQPSPPLMDPEDTAGSWIGMVVIKKNDGRFLIPNYWNDTIEIRSLANVGDSWTFYQDSSTKYYTATIIATDTMTLPGGLDSVKRIQLLAYDNGVLQTADSFHQAEIVLSKQQGICAAMEFYMFPFHAPGDTLIYNDYYLVNSMRPLMHLDWPGAPTPGPYAGIFRQVNINMQVSSDYNEMNVGDEYLYEECVQASTGSLTTCPTPFYRYVSVVSKTPVTGGVQYAIQGWVAALHYLYGQYYYLVQPGVDTFVLSSTTPYLDIYRPESPHPIGPYQGELMYYYPEDTTYCLQGERFVTYQYTFFGRTYSSHKPGLGRVILTSSEYGTPSLHASYLIYYNRNGVSCGTFALPDTTVPVPVSVREVGEERSASIYPNPATNDLTVTGTEGCLLQLVNMMGQVVYAKDLCGEKERINVSQLADGVYLVKVQRDKEPVLSRKVLVQH